jgi:hypothetical protein
MRTVTPRQVSCPTEVSPLHATRRFETILPSTTQRPPSPLSHATPQLDGSPLAGARLRQWLAGSPGPSGRIKFVNLRTGLSPPVALHLASRRRSYLQFPGRRAYAWGGLTPPYVCARGRTSHGFQPVVRRPDFIFEPLQGHRHGLHGRNADVLCGTGRCVTRPCLGP